jgi:hypothetical protein
MQVATALLSPGGDGGVLVLDRVNLSAAAMIASRIAGDEHARSRNGIILTRLLADSLAGGSSQRLASEFAPLPRLTAGPHYRHQFSSQLARPTRALRRPRWAERPGRR